MSHKHIHVIAPSSHVEENMIQTAVAWLESKNYKVSIAPQVFYKNNQSAGTIEDKINALHHAFSNPDIDIIMTSCGGNGAIHLLDHIDFDLIKKNPKPFIGFSDITLLLNAIYTKTGIPTFHGPSLTQIQKPLPDDQLSQFLSILKDEPQDITWKNVETIKNGNAKGLLIGGNLSVFQTLIGTPYLYQENEPIILFFEDVGDEISRYDRMLGHLRQSGVLHRASAILFGDFHASDNPTRVPFGKTIKDIIIDNTNELNIPIVMNCPFGHRGNLWTLPVGKMASITIDNDGIAIHMD